LKGNKAEESKMSLFTKTAAGKKLDKPQNKFTEFDNKKIEAYLVDYMVSQGADAYGLKELAREIRLICFNERIDRTAESAAEVWTSAADKIYSMQIAAEAKIEELDATGELEKMMAAIHNRVDRKENPEAYC
jgi:hypothetical protein